MTDTAPAFNELLENVCKQKVLTEFLNIQNSCTKVVPDSWLCGIHCNVTYFQRCCNFV